MDCIPEMGIKIGNSILLGLDLQGKGLALNLGISPLKPLVRVKLPHLGLSQVVFEVPAMQFISKAQENQKSTKIWEPLQMKVSQRT